MVIATDTETGTHHDFIMVCVHGVLLTVFRDGFTVRTEAIDPAF